MGSPYLNTNESIILSAHDLVINMVSAEAILTNQRLMLVDKNHPRILPQDILFTAVETVTIGDNMDNDPVLTLSVVTPDGTRQPLGMAFPQSMRTERTAERDEWAARIRELSIIAQREGGIVAMELTPPWIPGTIPEEPSDGEPTEFVPAGTHFKTSSLSERRSRAANASKNRMIGIVIAALIIIALIAAGVFIYAPSFIPQPIPQVTPDPTQVPTQVPTPTDTQTPPATPEVTEIVPPTQVQSIIPHTGVWVRVIYDGTYSGTAGPSGRVRDIKGSGDQFFQVPAKDEIMSASITKQDNSGNPLAVEIYYEGVMVKTATITRPGGTLDLDVNLQNL
ncbi:MAG: hypothetical protein M0Q92_06615 [Methanoregula sp.]|nr:hypothetical protein [Methanoregula sp.]